MSRFQWPSIRRIMKRNSYQHKNKICSTYFTSYTICLDQITLPSPCAGLPTIHSYNYTSQGRQYSLFIYNNASILDATQTYAPSYAQYQLQLQLKLLQSRCFSSNHRGRGTRGRVPRMSEMKSLEEALTATYDNLDRLSPRDISAFWAVVPKFLGGKGPMRTNQQLQQQMFHQFDKISTKSIQDIEQYGYRELATLAISLAKIIDKISKRERPVKGSPLQILQDILIGNESKIKQYIFREIASSSVPILHEFEPRHLSNFIYAFGLAEDVVLVEDGSTFFDMLAKQVISFNNMDEFKPQELSNISWAYANVKVSNSQLFKKIGDHIVTMNNLNEFWPQELSNILWAFATAEEKHPKLFKRLADQIIGLDNLHNFKPQELSNTIWSFATAGESHPILFKKMADHIVQLPNINEFWPQALKDLVWAYATAEESHPQLFRKIADRIISLDSLDEFWPQTLSNTVWAFATASESHPNLFKKLAEEAIKRQHDFKPQELANFLWAHATNGQVDEHLFSSLVPSVLANLDKYNAQSLINVAWAYSVANVNASSVFNNDFINACLIRKKENDFIEEDFRQLHQWQLWQEEIKSDISLPPPLKKKCYEAFISRIPEPSKFQDDVISILSSMDLQPQEEVLMKSGYRIDAVVDVNGKQIAVEVDGPSHFIGRSRELTGSTILKHRQVVGLDGMPVVAIPYWEWDKLKDRKKKEQYLRHSLGLIKATSID